MYREELDLSREKEDYWSKDRNLRILYMLLIITKLKNKLKSMNEWEVTLRDSQ
jgi:hypothetical protein